MKEKFREIIQQCIKGLQQGGGWPAFVVPDINVEYPADTEHGDAASNVAMRLAKLVSKKPLDIAFDIKKYYDDEHHFDPNTRAGTIEIAGPGFLNFTANAEYLSGQLSRMLKAGKNFGDNNLGAGKKMLVEFISANPTGPLTLANGRGGFTGDALANVLKFSGYRVTKEYYVNDVGNQIQTLAESVARRYLQYRGVTVEYPEHLYQGDYIMALAQGLDITLTKDTMHDPEIVQKIAEQVRTDAMERMLKKIQQDVEEQMKIHFDEWFRESSLYENFDVKKFIKDLESRGIAYEKDEAVWLQTTAHGDDKDRVIIKKDGEQTYFLSDVLYQKKRFVDDGYDAKILILGADHHGYVRRLLAVAAALGFPGKLDVLIMQLVKLVRGGTEVRMSKRKGNFVTAEEVIEEVGVDVARFFFLMYSRDTHMTFDLDVAREQSEKNPVFYVQYAYARIRSIEREMEKRQLREGLQDRAFNPFDSEAAPAQKPETYTSSKALVKELLKFPDTVKEVAVTRETQHLPMYVLAVAKKFHAFYRHCRVIDERYYNVMYGEILLLTKQVIGKTLELMGITAPEEMLKK